MTDEFVSLFVTTFGRSAWQGTVLALLVVAILWIFGQRIPARFRFLLIGVVLVRFLLPCTPPVMTSMFELSQHVTNWVPTFFELPEIADVENSTLTVPSAFSENTTPQNISSDFPNPILSRKNENELKIISAQISESVNAAEYSQETPFIHRDVLILLAIRVVLFVWIAGILFMAIRFLRDEFRLFKKRQHWKIAEIPELLRIIAECRKQCSLRQNVPVFVTQEPIGAASCGIFYPAIVLSQKLTESFDTEEWRLILLHEMLHHKRLDPLTQFLSQIVFMLHWLNPFVWILLSRFRLERELAVDESVVRLTGQENATNYGNVVLKVFRQYATVIQNIQNIQTNQSIPALLGVQNGNQSQDKLLERRITMILKSHPNTLFRVLFGMLLLAGLIVTGLTDAQTIKKTDDKPVAESVVTEKTAEQIVHVTAEKSATSTNDVSENILVRLHFVDEADKPVPNAEVYYSFNNFNYGENAGITDENGVYEFTCKRKDCEFLSVIAVSSERKLKSWQSYEPSMWGDINKNIVDSKIKLTSSGRIITGTVKDLDGKPVEGAFVGGCVEMPLPPFVKSKPDGSFILPYVGMNPKENRLYQIYAVKPEVGFACYVTEEVLEWEGETPPEKISNGPFHLVLDKPQTIQVRVTDEQGTPIPDAIAVVPAFRVGTNEATDFKSFFRPGNVAAPPFFQKTNANGLATFDWIPAKSPKNLSFTARGGRETVKMQDGTSKYFGESDYVYWNQKDSVVPVTLPQQAKVKIRFVKEDGSPASRVGASLEWTTKTRPMTGEALNIIRQLLKTIPFLF
jgi:beta-lactamase regulating signal transducer with metallopeptidase domain